MELIERYLDIKKRVTILNENATLVAVSKTRPVEDIKQLYDLGHRDFGENRVQELLEKYDNLPKDIRWHLIGHLQTNKIKYIIDKVHLIHSLDSIHLANELNNEAKKRNIIIDVLIQINFSQDKNKFGFSLDEYMKALIEISTLKHLNIKGIMLIPKFTLDNHYLSKLFYQFSSLKLDIEAKKIDNVSIKYLSFGMSNDFELALNNGSNMVRVGSSIFGSR